MKYKNNIPFIAKGLELDRFWFSGGRTGATLLGHGGLGEILYYGAQQQGGQTLFKTGSPESAFEKLFRICVVIDGTAYYPEFNNTRLYPFGYTSECALEGVGFRHELILLNDALVQRVVVLDNPGGHHLALKLILHGHNRASSEHREWSAWQFDETLNALSCSAFDEISEEVRLRQIEEKRNDLRLNFPVSDVLRGKTYLAVGSELHTSMLCAGGGFKYYLNTEPFTGSAAFFLVFNPERSGLAARMGSLREGCASECAQVFSSYGARMAESPGIYIPGQSAVQSCLRNVPAIIDSLEVKDIPGGFRAAAHGYWIWADLFAAPSAFCWANDSDSLRDMLSLFRSVADPELGYPKLLTTTLKPLLGFERTEQTVFICALYSHFCHTGDVSTLAGFYPFATWLMEKCLETEAGDTGLFESIGGPDCPMDMDGHDLVSSANSIAFQALRCMEELACRMGDCEAAARYGAMARKTSQSFLKYFYDHEKGYFIDSVSSRDFSRRIHYLTVAIQWYTHFAAELLGDHAAGIAAFQAAHFTRRHGIGGMIPVWDPGYPGDGNQLISYYPSWTEVFYRNTMRLAGRAEGLEKWFDDVAWFWNQNTTPEGFTYDAENEGFTVDNPGSKQAFGAQAWYVVFFSAILGLAVDTRGLTVSPSPLRRRISVKNLRIRNCRIDVTVSGEENGGVVFFNGQPLAGSELRILFSELKPNNTLVW